MGSKNWIEWHSEYDQPGSSLARRLSCVRAYLRQALAAIDAKPQAQLQITSICAGDGRDVLPVVAESTRRPKPSVTVIESDPVLAERARQSAGELEARVVPALKPNGIVIWTRGRPDEGNDPSQEVRRQLQAAGFSELGFTAPQDARFRVGMSQLRDGADPSPDIPPRIFTFVT